MFIVVYNYIEITIIRYFKYPDILN